MVLWRRDIVGAHPFPVHFGCPEMKRLFLALFIPSMLLASPENPTRDELLQTVKHIAALAKETQAELDAEKSAHAQTEVNLAGALKANQDTQAQFDSYRTAVGIQLKKGNDAIAQLNHVIKKLHLAKWVLCGVWVAFCAMLLLKIPLPLSGYIASGLGLAGVTFIWLWL